MTYCPHCKQELHIDAFYRNVGRETGRSVLCKVCYRAYEATPERRAKRTWNTIRARVTRQASYDGIEVRMSRDEFLGWAVPEFTAWMRAYPGQTPSLDRIDPSRHYELSNLRVIERGENSRRASNHPNVHAPIGMAWCGGECKTYLPASCFWREKGAFNGLQGKCKPCTTSAIKRSRGSPVDAP